MRDKRQRQENLLPGWTVRQPTPYERAQIRAVTGCDDSTIRNVFDKIAGKPVKREPADVSFVRVIDGGKRVGLIVPDTALAETA